jgi:DNA-binding Lrp family transcriptional regulator
MTHHQKMKTATSSRDVVFPGFDTSEDAKFFKYPSYMDRYWYLLSGSEQKVLDFILRQLIGFYKTEDAIAYSQIESGVRGFSNGTGLSRSQVYRAVNALEEKGFIKTIRQNKKPHVFQLVTREETVSPIKDVEPLPEIARLIRLFEPVAGHLVEKYLNSKKEQDAIVRLIDFYGEKHLESVINSLPLIQGAKYVPNAVSPSELEAKYPKLVLALKRMKTEQESTGMVL